MPEGEISFIVSDIGKVSIKCMNGQYTIMGQPQEEFPAEQAIENGITFPISGKELKSIINNTAYATSRDDLKPVLQGLLFKMDEEGFISVATDGHRLVKFEKKNINTNNYKGTVVVPTKFLSLLNNLIEEEENSEMIIGENHIQISIKNGKITSRIIKDNFPFFMDICI
jgi:DNA polymerase-3 subunit beta